MGIRAKLMTAKIGPLAIEEGEQRTLWKARLRIQNEKQEFLFRSTDEFQLAAKTAQELLETSPSCQMVGAEIVAVERMARLWN